jgi:hypothetical protein
MDGRFHRKADARKLSQMLAGCHDDLVRQALHNLVEIPRGLIGKDRRKRRDAVRLSLQDYVIGVNIEVTG